MHVTKAKLSKHPSAGTRARYIAHLKKEFAKALEVIEKEPIAVHRGTMHSYMAGSSTSHTASSSSSVPSSGVPGSTVNAADVKPNAAKKAKRQIMLGNMKAAANPLDVD